MAYNTAKNRSKNKELFGKGSYEGVAASEAGNNAVTGGACIPMMTLGIPGSAAAAVLMGGLMIHGLQPGTYLFAEKGLRQAVNLSRGNLLSYYLHRPISLVITALIVIGIFLPMVLDKIKASRSEDRQKPDGQ